VSRLPDDARDGGAPSERVSNRRIDRRESHGDEGQEHEEEHGEEAAAEDAEGEASGEERQEVARHDVGKLAGPRQRSSVRVMNNLIAKIRGWFTTNKK